MTIKSGENASTDLSQLGDEDYLVARSKLARKTDSAEAKSWMITAKMMFPKNVSIQYEAYLLEKEEKKAAEAAKYLREMFHGFRGTEVQLKLGAELAKMVAALQNDKMLPAGEDALLVGIYNCLPKETQQEVLLDSASKASDMMIYARQLLLAFERFPKLIPTHGTEFMLKVLNRCKKQPAVSSIDPLLQLLVMEMCPKLLANSKLKTDVSVLDDILRLTVQFCCAYLSGIITKSPTVAKSPWSTIFTFVEEIGLRMGWSLTEDLGEISPDALWQRIQSFVQRQSKHDGDRQNELFFVSMLLFLRSLSDYMQTEGETVLVEAFVTHLDSQPLKRRRTLDDDVPVITHGDDHHSKLIEAFLQAFRYYDLLRADQGLDAKLQQYRSHTHFFSSFQSDVALYQGNFREALQILNALQTPQSPADQCRLFLKIATIQFCVAKHNTAADFLIQAVTCVPSAPSSSSANATKGIMLKQATAFKSRHVHFLPFSRQHILAFCARVLVYVLKDSLQATLQDNDLALGHVIVLLQYIYPEEVDLFYLLLNRIRCKDSFSYPSFCNYVVHVEFLEEFSALLNDVSCKVLLDITPTVANQRRMGTRGANRGEKEEIRAALKKQVLRCHESLDDILIEFLAKNKETILSCLQ